MNTTRKISIIGSGVAGIAAACYLAKNGYEVDIFEKNGTPGGRVRQLTTDNGYLFDMGPSWYWMPDVFERFFNDFGYTVADFYQLELLNPAFEIVFADKDIMRIPKSFSDLCQLFESIEEGSAIRLEKFIQEAKFKYEVGMKSLVYMPGLSLTEFADFDLIKNMLRLDVFTSFSRHIKKYFSNPKLIALMEFPVLFLGAMPQHTPALYSLMNYAGLVLGTWYPQGGFGKVINAIVQVAEKNGVCFHFNTSVEEIIVEKQLAKGLVVNGELIYSDAVIGAADYHHIENRLLPASYRNYEEDYWKRKTFAPSCLIHYIGISKKIHLQHHTLFFEEDLHQHSIEIYKNPQWPTRPLFYVCCPSKSDKAVAPAGHENLFLLMPIAPGLEDDTPLREKYFRIMISRLEKHLGDDIHSYIDFKQSYCINNFIADYNSYKGNAYGLANTLSQTAILKPKIKNKKVSNLFYAGQLTVPGPGVPPSLISGKIAAEQLVKYFKN